jgi:hypothetical protein
MSNRFARLVLGCALCAPAVFAQEAPATEDPAEERSPATPAESSSTATPTASSSAAGAARTDRLDLDTTVVTGNRELPKVLYIVPWKKAELGELPAQPFNTLLDEVLAPVDREEFRREVKYYGTLAGRDQPPFDRKR